MKFTDGFFNSSEWAQFLNGFYIVPLCINNMQGDSPMTSGVLWQGECLEDGGEPFQASCSLSQRAQLCFEVKYAEEWKLLSPGVPRLLQSLAYAIYPVWCHLQWLLSMHPTRICSSVAFRAPVIFIKSALNTSFEWNSPRENIQSKVFNATQEPLGSKGASGDSWKHRSILYSPSEASLGAQWGRAHGLHEGNLLGQMQSDTITSCWAQSLARRWPWGPGVPGPSSFSCGGKVSSASYQDTELNIKFLDMCCLAPKQRDFCSL